MRKRGGIDSDDILFPLFGPFIEWHNKEYGTTVAYEDLHAFDFHTVLGIPLAEAKKRIVAFKATGFMESREPLPDAVSGIPALVSLDHVLHIVSAGDPLERATRHAVTERHFPFLFAGHHLVGYENGAAKKAAVAQQLGLDYFVDDNAENCRRVAAARIQTFLVTRPWNRNEHVNGIIRVDSLTDVVRYLS